ncbi:MAG: type III-A CRISPR-associated protein Cas10/Csm1 [Pseudomonadota bacterium]
MSATSVHEVSVAGLLNGIIRSVPDAGLDGLPWPDSLDRGRLDALARIVAAAESLAGGPVTATGGRAALRAIVSSVKLERGGPAAWHAPAPLSHEAILPVGHVHERAMENGLRTVEAAFRDGWKALCAQAGHDAAAFEEGLLSLSERLFWAVPADPVGQPDVPLHDHARLVAAFAAALHGFQAAATEGGADPGRPEDPAPARFRFLVGDLSGLQRTLYRLKAQGVEGLARLLRGRSMRFQLIADAAVRRALSAFGMPMSAALQTAGGRFLILVPALPDAESRLDALRAEADDWLAAQYAGDLALGLALSAPFAADDLTLREDIARAVEIAKLRQMPGPAAAGVLALAGGAGECPACGQRPAVDGPHCPACAAEIELGGRLPKARAVAVGADAAAADRLIGLAYLLPLGEGAAAHDRGRGWRWMGAAGHGPAALRPGPPHVARFGPGDAGRYPDLAKAKGITDLGTDRIEEGTIKTFPCLALDACEGDGRGGLRGRPMLVMLKGDVDRLGRIFAHGLGPRWSLARGAALSRMVDLCFTLRLPALLAAEFPETYTLYAGGDDFVLIAPWRKGLSLALRLREDFRVFAGENPDLTFSLGAALFDPRTPVSTAAREAETRLQKAKAAGRDRILVIEDEPMTWQDYRRALEAAYDLRLGASDPRRGLGGEGAARLAFPARNARRTRWRRGARRAGRSARGHGARPATALSTRPEGPG